ncbi:hypothetical protein [Nitrincola sp. MINF-07-Sa-05]|uniref:hypothetical protein n=1 Tax=Nitrincola salilacus TaxID=3400273 RepID=UPI003917D5E1
MLHYRIYMIKFKWIFISLICFAASFIFIPSVESANHSHEKSISDDHVVLLKIIKYGRQGELDAFLDQHRGAKWLEEEVVRASIVNELMYEAKQCDEDIFMTLSNYKIMLSSKKSGSPYNYLGYLDSTDEIVKCINIFVRAGIDINTTDEEGKTALVHVLYSHHSDTLFILEKLIDNGADPTIRTEQGADLLHHSLMLRILYGEVLPVDVQDDDPFTIEAKKMIGITKQVNHLFNRYYVSKRAD